jgi:hypothetical protein
VAAVVYALAGWLGSAVGIMVAENRHELPRGLVAAAAAAVTLALAGRYFFRRGRMVEPALRAG